ncbi:ATP-dependent protease [Photobacterium leiognathi]|nr:ATP-dependent protease [Photobacterium leiognathi]
MQIPLFPLDIYLLPGGVSKLRIFEPRYIKLVKIAATNNYGFGLCMSIDNTICHFGTRVVITDFDSLPDGVLSITIQAKELFLLDDHWRDEDELYFGEISAVPNWRSTDIDYTDVEIANSLKLLFKEHPDHASYYPSPNFNDMTWVCQRWLEILPLEVNQKQWFMSRNDHTAALSFLHTVIDDNLQKNDR